MSKELVIGSNRHETKAAILEEDQLVEVDFQRANEYSLAGSIHKGRVTRVLPGMQSAFVDLGLERDTFLYVSDFFEEHDDIDTVGDEKPARTDRRELVTSRAQEKAEDDGPRLAEVREIRPPGPDIVTSDRELLDATSAAAPLVSAPEAAATEPRLAEKPDAERGFRGGDRRGRRSRRRRQRGHGFPDNKYAQPEVVDRSPQIREPETDEPASGDLILLPGESLAKYRSVNAQTSEFEHINESADTDAEDSVAESDPAIDTGTADPLNEDFAAEQEAIEEEAEELELADKVLSHHDDQDPEAVEEKIEEVREESRPPSAEAAGEAGGVGAAAASAEQRAPEPGSSEPPPAHYAPVNLAESSEETEQQLFSESVDAAELLPEAGVLEHHPGRLEAEELLAENGELSPGPSAEETTTLSTDRNPELQTASVREQGNRYLHRMSRRNRRRRSSSRPFQSSEVTPGSGASGTAIAAAAIDSDTRPAQVLYEERSAEKPERALPSISDLLKPGQEIIVQIAKEPLGQKGARITSHIALPGRYVVFMPSVSHLGVSRKIASDEERQRLKRILQTHRVGTIGGFIVRTAGEGVPEDEIAADMNFLYSLWLDIRQKAEKKPAPVLLHHDLDIVQRILRDQVTEDFKAIWVDNEDMYENVLTFMQRFQPNLVNRVKMYTRPAPIFDAFNITQELEKALRPKVWLKSGGYIVINQTEALVAIDINTGKYVGKSNRLEDTIVKTNTEAVKEIVRQIRLRDLGGIIVVDFIDMDERKNRQKVMQALEEAMRADKAPYKILQFNDFGLVAITRKRVKQSLERTLCEPCSYCEGAGYVKSVQTIISEILVEAQKIARAIDGKDVVLRTHPNVAKVLKASNNRYLEELEEILGRPVLVSSDPSLHHEKFDLG
jgi:ribonuclease G